jgi:hypothetical protein
MVSKYIVVIRTLDPLPVTDFRDAFLSCAAKLCRLAPAITRLNSGVVADSSVVYEGKTHRNRPSVLPWSGMLTLWLRPASVFFSQDNETDGEPILHFIDEVYGNVGEVLNAWRVDEHIGWDRRSRSEHEISPYFKQVSFVAKWPELAKSEFERLYADHEILASVHHPSFASYIQNVVAWGVSRSGGVPSCDAISESVFRTEEDFLERYFAGPESPAIVGADTRKFLDPEHTTWTLIYEWPLDCP